MTSRGHWLWLGALLLVLIPLEGLAAQAAYETLGEVTSTIYWMALILNLVPLLFAIRFPKAGLTLALLLGLALVPYQVVLVGRLWRVQQEADRVVHYAQQQFAQTGRYPADLKGYVSPDPGAQRYIQRYDSDPASQFTLSYRVGTPNTSHTYSSEGGWSYYPD